MWPSSCLVADPREASASPSPPLWIFFVQKHYVLYYIKRVRNLTQNAGNGHFRHSNFQKFMREHAPRPPRNVAPSLLLVHPSPPPTHTHTHTHLLKILDPPLICLLAVLGSQGIIVRVQSPSFWYSQLCFLYNCFEFSPKFLSVS